MRSLGIASPLYLLALLIILAFNITLLAVFRSRLILIKRSGNAFLINFILLIFGGHPNIFSDRINISREFKCFFHNWLGAIALLECIVHVGTALGLTQFRVGIFSSSSSIAGFIPLRISSLSTILLIVPALMCVVMISIRLGLTFWMKADVSIVEVKNNGLLRVKLHLRRPCKIYAGQYVSLRIPTSLRYFNESHPFFISSWENDGNENAKNITLLIQRMSGFTRRLRATTVGAFLEGPYGYSPVSGNDSNFIFFASGIGIAAQLGSIKQLLDARDRGPTKTQRITLLWEVNEIGQWGMAIEMVHQLLDQDENRCLRETPDWPLAKRRHVSHLFELS
ncbi:FAD-binding domain-containing protein [Rutstroemia sp. NJR-2017a BBW]|nr:FAD-binding domain-containing protein [Rutstroemia sp. NJR-2017a BBW]